MTTATGSRPPRQRYARGEGERLRTDLLEAAAELMAEHGSIDGISLRAVARRAGVSPTAVYRHFDDHVDLLSDAVTFCWRNFRDALVAAAAEADDAFDSFARMGVAYVEFAQHHPGQYRVMFSNRIAVDGSDGAVAESTFEMLVGSVAAMLSALGDDRDAGFVAMQVQTWIHGIVDLRSCHPTMDWPRTADLLDGIAVALGLGPDAAIESS